MATQLQKNFITPAQWRDVKLKGRKWKSIFNIQVQSILGKIGHCGWLCKIWCRAPNSTGMLLSRICRNLGYILFPPVEKLTLTEPE